MPHLLEDVINTGQGRGEPIFINRRIPLIAPDMMFEFKIFQFPVGVSLLINAKGAPPWSSGSVLDHRSLPPVFESRRGHIWRLFRLWLRLITFGGRSAHLAYFVHKSGRKTSIIINHHHQLPRDTIDRVFYCRSPDRIPMLSLSLECFIH